VSYWLVTKDWEGARFWVNWDDTCPACGSCEYQSSIATYLMLYSGRGPMLQLAKSIGQFGWGVSLEMAVIIVLGGWTGRMAENGFGAFIPFQLLICDLFCHEYLNEDLVGGLPIS